MICPRCNAEIKDDSKYCPECGKSLFTSPYRQEFIRAYKDYWIFAGLAVIFGLCIFSSIYLLLVTIGLTIYAFYKYSRSSLDESSHFLLWLGLPHIILAGIFIAAELYLNSVFCIFSGTSFFFGHFILKDGRVVPKKIVLIIREIRDTEHKVTIDYILPKMKNLMRSDKEGLKHILLSRDPRCFTYSMIANVTADYIESGRFHLHRGVLSPDGEKLLALCQYALDKLVEYDDVTEADTKEQMSAILNNLKEVG